MNRRRRAELRDAVIGFVFMGLAVAGWSAFLILLGSYGARELGRAAVNIVAGFAAAAASVVGR